jgi:DNA-binding NtrC family response regulator
MVDDQTKTQATLILVVETETTARVSLSELLRDEGYLVVEAADSGSALTQISRDQTIKVVLADLEMPSWTTIIQQARANLPNSFILGMVRYGALPNAYQAQRFGANTHLVKPISFADVNHWIRHYLTGSSQFKP